MVCSYIKQQSITHSKSYTWCVVTLNNNQLLTQSPIHGVSLHKQQSITHSKSYTWCVVTLNNNQLLTQSPIHGV